MESKTEKAVQSVKASMAIEGLEPSDFSYEIYKLIVEGKITVDEAMEMIKKYHGVKQ